MSSRKSRRQKENEEFDSEEERERFQHIINGLKDESVKLADQISQKRDSMSKFDDKFAALLIERNFYLRILRNLSEVCEREPDLAKIEAYLDATPEELEKLMKPKQEEPVQ